MKFTVIKNSLSEFEKDSIKTINISKKDGIQATIGCIKGETKTEVHSFLFNGENWDKEKSEKWAKDNGSKVKSFDLEDSLDLKALEKYEKDHDLLNTHIYREFNAFEVKKLDDEDKREGIEIEGYLSTFKNMDRYGDIVKDEAFKNTIKDIKKNRGGILPMLRNHSNKTQDLIGSWTKFKVDDVGLYVTGFISKTENTEHEIRMIEDGHLNTLSMGGMFRFEENKGKNFIAEVELLEGSVVVIPANPKAQFSKKSFLDQNEKSHSVDTNNANISKKDSKDEKLKQINEILKKQGVN